MWSFEPVKLRIDWTVFLHRQLVQISIWKQNYITTVILLIVEKVLNNIQTMHLMFKNLFQIVKCSLHDALDVNPEFSLTIYWVTLRTLDCEDK